jgi:hypothetical protein
MTNPDRKWYFHYWLLVVEMMVPLVIEMFLYCIAGKKRFTIWTSCYIQREAVVERRGFSVEQLDSEVIVFIETLIYDAFWMLIEYSIFINKWIKHASMNMNYTSIDQLTLQFLLNPVWLL